MWLTGLMCGLRPGELAGLRWPFVDRDSDNPSLEVAIGHHEIGERDVRRILSQVHLPAENADREIIHTLPVGYFVDGTEVSEPRGMYGERLRIDVHMVTAASTAMRNLQVCVRRAHLEIADRAATP